MLKRTIDNVYIETRWLKYVPAKMRPFLVWLDRQDNSCDNSHCYFATFEKDGKQYSMEVADTVSEITWNCKELLKEMDI